MINGKEVPNIGAPKPTKTDAKRAITTMSSGFLKAMEFLQNHGMPKDLMVEAMRIGQQHGLCIREDGLNLAAGVREVRFVNPYVKLFGEQAGGTIIDDPEKTEDK